MSTLHGPVTVKHTRPRLRSLVLGLALGASVGSVVALTGEVVGSGEASAAMPVCRDSNGARSGGSVYVRDGRATGCDVVRPQRLHVTGVRSRSACDDMGGHGWVPSVKVCWDVDY
jgi:hypothetical protein